MSAKKWESCTALTPNDTISGLEFSRRNLLSCISWDGTLSIVDPLNPVSTYKTTQSRPLFAQSWDPTGQQLWFGGGEAKISCLNLNQMVTIDCHPTAGAVLALQVVETANQTLVVADEKSTFLLDIRGKNLVPISSVSSRSVDVQDNLLLTTSGPECALFDLRFPVKKLQKHTLAENANALQVKWLDSQTYALTDKCSRVHVYSVSAPSFAFYSNRFEPANKLTKQPRPIYALQSVPYANGSQLATGGSDHHVYVWDHQKRSLQAKMRFPMPCVAIAYSRWGNLAAVGLSNDDWSVTSAQYASPSRARVVFAHTIG